MADGSIYVALISASAAILGAAVSAISIARQNARQAERDRQQRREEQRQRREEEVRTACLDLLRAAVDLRTQVENNKEYQGPKMRARLSRVRKHASDAFLHSVHIGMIEPRAFADLSGKLARAARNVEVASAENTSLEMNMANEVPDLRDLNDCIEAFGEKAVTYAKGDIRLSAPVASKLPRDLTMLR
jgi:hypothetical protein